MIKVVETRIKSPYPQILIQKEIYLLGLLIWRKNYQYDV